MNQHAFSAEPGGYIFAFSISRIWLRIAELCAVAAAVIAVVATATEPYRAPLAIALGAVAITMLTVFTHRGSSRRTARDKVSAQARSGGHRILPGKMRGRRSVAADLALLAELHAKGTLSDEEFSAAKLRTLRD